MRESPAEHQVLRYGRYHADAPLRCGSRFDPEPHREEGCTPQYALVYVSQGKVDYCDAEGTRQEVGVGMAFQRFPETPHLVFYTAGTRTHFLAVPPEVFSLMRKNGLADPKTPVLALGTDHDFVVRHTRLTEELQNASPIRLMATLTRMQQLLVDMHLHASSGQDDLGETMEQACLILGSDLHRPLEMPDVARELGLSYSTFRRRFRQSVGCSPNGYRILRRIERAQAMLLEGVSISETGERLGYADLYIFSAQFKKVTGRSPRAYLREQGR